MKMIRPHTMVGDLAAVYAEVQHPQWYVATENGILIFGPFSSLEEAAAIGRAAQIESQLLTDLNARFHAQAQN